MLTHKIGSDIDERFRDLCSILTGRVPFCLAELADVPVFTRIALFLSCAAIASNRDLSGIM